MPAGDWPAEGLERVDVCPVCHCSERSLMFDDLRDRIFFCAPGHWTMYRCGDCGSGYLDPRPTPETIGRAYEQYYTHNDPEEVPTGELGSLRRLRRRLANGYKNWRFGSGLVPSNRIGVAAAYLIPSMRGLLDRQFRHLPRHESGGRVLDVGCGDGGFLRNAEAMGWQAVGTDLDPVVVENANKRGLDVRLGTVEGLDGPFDAITISHVIEHVHDPVAVIASCFALLADNGTLWIETPNINARGLKRFGEDWRGLEPPRHLVLFSRRALANVLQVSGFVQIRDLPQSGAASGIFTMSEKIRARRCQHESVHLSLAFRIQVLLARLIEYYRPEERELLALIGRKVGVNRRAARDLKRQSSVAGSKESPSK